MLEASDGQIVLGSGTSTKSQHCYVPRFKFRTWYRCYIFLQGGRQAENSSMSVVMVGLLPKKGGSLKREGFKDHCNHMTQTCCASSHDA